MAKKLQVRVVALALGILGHLFLPLETLPVLPQVQPEHIRFLASTLRLMLLLLKKGIGQHFLEVNQGHLAES